MDYLIRKFEQECKEYERACITNEYRKVNKKHDVIQRTFNEIKEANKLSEMLDLLENSNEVVRLWASSKLLPFFELQARRVLEAIINGNTPNSSSAKIILDTFDGKELKFP